MDAKRAVITGLAVLTALLTRAPATGAMAETAAPRLGTFVLDPARSTLSFVVSRPGETVEGRAPAFTGTIRADPRRLPEGASVVVRVEAAAMVTGNRLRDHKMRGSHLEVDTYPEIVFESTAVQPGEAPGGASAAGASVPQAAPTAADGALPVVVEGRLRLHGVERPLRIPAVIGYHDGLLTADGEVVFTLSEFAIPIPRFLWMILDDKVTVRFHAVATGPE